MKKLLVLLGVLLSVAVAGAGVAQANHSGPELRVYGHGLHGSGVFGFDFSARLGPREALDPVFGESHGTMKATHRNPVTLVVSTATAEVTCLAVAANRATIWGNITRVTGPFFATLRSLQFFVVDNTLPSGVNLTPDQWDANFHPVPAQQVCTAPTGGFTPIAEGDIVVEQN